MSLRLKFTVFLGLVIALAITLSTSTVYWIAREQLEKAAAERLQQTAWLVSTQIEERFDTLVQGIEVWARAPLVREVLQNADAPETVDRVNRIFAHIVWSNPVFQTFNLFNTKAAMIASSIPERVGFPVAQTVVEKRTDFLAALAGKTSIKGPFMGLSSAQPVISVSVPVQSEGHVIGVLRPVVDIADFNEKFLKPLAERQEGKIFIYTPELDTGRTLTPADPTLEITTPYVPPNIPSIPKMLNDQEGVVRYTSDGVRYFAAFRWMKRPRVLIIAALHLSRVLAPIRYVKYAALTIALIMLATIWFAAGMAVRPLLFNLRECIRFVRRIRDGSMEARIHVKSHDDVSELADGLNKMVERLHSQRAALISSEAKYRSIFENAAEGVFQTALDGRFLTANRAMAKILGFDDPERLQGLRTDAFYAKTGERAGIINTLEREGRITNHEFDVRRQDGAIGKCLMNATAHTDDHGRITMIQGILHDVTRERRAEAARRRAETAEKLALEARLRALRYQLNPHFLFNVLNTIDVLSRKAPQQISDLLQKLAAYLRYAIEPISRMRVTLDDEVSSIKNYLAVEKVRFRDHLEVAFHVTPDAGKLKVPDMLLQPLIENAVKYGMRTSGMPLRVIITAQRRDGRLVLSVENTGRWYTEQHAGPGIGLKNLRERLEIFYSHRFSLKTGEANGRVRVEINLPLEAAAVFHSPK